jgi:hypothetical protein
MYNSQQQQQQPTTTAKQDRRRLTLFPNFRITMIKFIARWGSITVMSSSFFFFTTDFLARLTTPDFDLGGAGNFSSRSQVNFDN